MSKKWKKQQQQQQQQQKILPTYLPYLFGAYNPQCRTQKYFHTVELVLVTNMWKKQFWLIMARFPPLYKRDGNRNSVYSS